MLTVWAGLRKLPSWAFPVAFAALLLAVPLFDVGYEATRYIELSLILALVVSGLNISLGYSGQLAIGQAAMYAAGAYTAGMLSTAGHTDLGLHIVAGGLAALVVGIVTGIPGLRLGSWSLAMTSFFLVLLVPDVVDIFEEKTGGHLGLSGMLGPTLFGYVLKPADMYLAIVVVAAVWFAVFRNVVVSRHGIAFQVLKQSPVLASSLGMSVYRTKLTGYAIGAVPAGFAGALLANLDLYLSPEIFGFHLATGALAASILGGSVSIYGAIFGAGIVQFNNDQSSEFAQYSLIFFGAFLLIGGVLLRGGVAGVMRNAVRRLDRAAGIGAAVVPAQATDSATAMRPISGGMLEVGKLSKAFGGNQALRDVSLRAEPGKITALIGPNGSGKTTLLNLVCGFYRRDSGSITVAGASIATASSDRIARLGIARTFQTPLIPPGITVREVVISGRYTADRAGFLSAVLRSPHFRRVRERDLQRATEILRLTGLIHLADSEAVALPLGMRRMLEVARALIREPKVLLLDEAASGLDENEVRTLASVVRQIRDAGCTVVLVEHNFDLVLALADRIVVLARGGVLAEGTPAEIEANVRVRDEYLGVVEEKDRQVSS
ncbi:branched-chain amino acid ABC transporter permease [Rhizocola hellebori]|uniref:Branched-chain amino acid ABC transporter permease n=1 Tax=Rhizocola hellebori TaxID=1392758 RepID=A0A8J3QA26_9ACTN|nr:branched-chain amino acid ABC transporter ATP-binding protein/permease [Rhizocola hellebori]GIH06691.1 branched-chain amino acid ABC transporter permease [Rhizocola hellebori]